jgi:hypothetical protein
VECKSKRQNPALTIMVDISVIAVIFPNPVLPLASYLAWSAQPNAKDHTGK